MGLRKGRIKIMAQCIDFQNLGYLMDDVPEDILNDLKREIGLLDEHSLPTNHTLAGNIEKEFDLANCIPKLEQYIFNLVKQYDNAYPYLNTYNCLTDDRPISLHELWVNLQKRTEFNPAHNHSGIMSFVIWLKIPFNIDDEHKSSPGRKSNNNCPGHFELLYTNTLGDIWRNSIPVDKDYEGKIIMFPNKMMHTVYPFFTSDEERITVAGNIRLKV